MSYKSKHTILKRRDFKWLRNIIKGFNINTYKVNTN